jgi:two-component system OmpR family sensor kinase
MIAAAEDPEFLRPEPIGLDHFTMEVLRKWMPTAERRWQLGRLDPVIVDADRERLGLAVDALLENAVRHTGDGDVIQLSVESAANGSAARMIISDTGPGIPAAELDHIFERFRSGSELGDGRRTGLGDGRRTGLGLALVRAVARAHGGEAVVRSVPGQGSEFELMLPVTGPAAAAALEAGTAPAAVVAPEAAADVAPGTTATVAPRTTADVAPAADVAPGAKVSPTAGLTAARPSEAGPGGDTAPATAPSPYRQPRPGRAAPGGRWRGRTR